MGLVLTEFLGVEQYRSVRNGAVVVRELCDFSRQHFFAGPENTVRNEIIFTRRNTMCRTAIFTRCCNCVRSPCIDCPGSTAQRRCCRYTFAANLTGKRYLRTNKYVYVIAAHNISIFFFVFCYCWITITKIHTRMIKIISKRTEFRGRGTYLNSRVFRSW